MTKKPKIKPETFRTSRLLDFASEKEPINQVGHSKADWPLVVLKELVDNSLDACEEADVPPEITVTMDQDGITVADNGPGIPLETVRGVSDYSVRVSSREAYVAPTRGAQGNALKTIVAMPYVLGGDRGQVTVTAGGQRYEIVYNKVAKTDDNGIPVVIETAFARRNDEVVPANGDGPEPSFTRRLIAGVNWSPAIGSNPFR